MTRKFVFLGCLVLALAYLILFVFPNRAASENLDMVSVIQPDEAVPLSYAIDMIRPADTVKQALINFAFYNYYFYGYPHFAYSALVLLPLKWANALDNMSLVMLTLRQMVSVLPMLAAILLLVYMQTKFSTYKAYLLLVFLLAAPAVVENNLWWHPDSLAILFVVLTLFFLSRDELRLGWNFYLAAAMCGFAIGTKGLGWYFFLAVAVYLLVTLFSKKASSIKVFYSGALFIVTMLAAYVFSNPLLVFASTRQQYLNMMETQFEFLQKGYEVVYDIGLSAATPEVRAYYGTWAMVLLALGSCVWGALRGPNRLLNQLIQTWFVPLTVLIFGFIHFKFQYWMPVILPLFSTLVLLFPDKISDLTLKRGTQGSALLARLFQWMGLAALVLQFSFYLVSDIGVYSQKLHAEEAEPAFTFYEKALDVLGPLPDNDYYVYHDVRIYVPETSGWARESRFEMLDYAFIEERNYNILLLLQQRIYDYLAPDVEGIDPASLAASQEFYADADAGALRGYQLLYRDKFGLIFVSDALHQSYYSEP